MTPFSRTGGPAQESPIVSAARVLDGQGEPVQASAGTELTSGAALERLQELVTARVFSEMLVNFHHKGLKMDQTPEARAMVGELVEGLVTGIFDKASVPDVESAKNSLLDATPYYPVYARANLLTAYGQTTPNLQEPAEVRLYLTQLQALRELPPLTPDYNNSLVFVASEQLNFAVSSLPDVSPVLNAQEELHAARSRVSGNPEAPAPEVAESLRVIAAGLNLSLGEHSVELQQDLHFLASEVEAGRASLEGFSAAQEKLDTLAASVAFAVTQDYREKMAPVQTASLVAKVGIQETAGPYVEQVFGREPGLSAGALGRSASVLAALAQDSEGLASANSSYDYLRGLLGPATEMIPDSDLKEMFGPDLAHQAFSLGITPSDVERAVTQLQEQASLEGTEPQHIDTAVALQALVVEGLARRGAELEVGHNLDDQTPVNEPTIEMDLELDAGD